MSVAIGFADEKIGCMQTSPRGKTTRDRLAFRAVRAHLLNGGRGRCLRDNDDLTTGSTPTSVTTMTKRSVSLDRLKEVHSFPGSYVFKVIGANSDQFVDRVVEVVVEATGEGAEPDVSTRESSGGKHVSVTMSLKVADAETVLEVYDALKAVDQVRFIL